MDHASGSTKPWTVRLDRLIDALEGEVILSYVAGARVLDLGYGSPEIARWTDEIAESRVHFPLDRWLSDAQGEIRLPLDANSFDVVVCTRTFAHLGVDAESSLNAARTLLAEASRVTTPGGYVLLEIKNPRSMRGLAQGIRRPITIVRGRILPGTDHRLDRYDTLKHLAALTPPTLVRQQIHAIHTLVPGRALTLPFIGPLIARAERWARDMPVIRHFGADLLVILRREGETR
ncbi:MAG: class I SAM-dependent methyltransferase [Nannocystis sp.]|nr:class I SAM-dependent methyltransferase [Nannocystis sp.]